MKTKITQNLLFSGVSLQNSKITLDPWFVTGLVDGDGGVGVSIRRNFKSLLGYAIGLTFEVGLDRKDEDLLKGLQAYFGVGGVYSSSGNMLRYKVSSIQDIIRVILPHFAKYPLVTQKRADFELLRCVIDILNSGPLSPEGLKKIVAIKATLNRGLTPELRASFPEIIPVERPTITCSESLQPMWVCRLNSSGR